MRYAATPHFGANITSYCMRLTLTEHMNPANYYTAATLVIEKKTSNSIFFFFTLNAAGHESRRARIYILP